MQVKSNLDWLFSTLRDYHFNRNQTNTKNDSIIMILLISATSNVVNTIMHQ